MDTSQFYLIIILTIITILTTIVGIQLIFTLKELRKAIKKVVEFIDNFDQVKKNHEEPKVKMEKKISTIKTVIDKIKSLSPSFYQKTKKIFKKNSFDI
ncbi:MAG: hypothetical protein ACPLRN_00875 [Microgenomates group bacterium]